MHLTSRWAAVGLLAVVVLGLFAHHRLSRPAAPRLSQAADTVAQVVDGDTIKVQGRGPVRFLGIDAPETRANSHGPKGCYGVTAKKHLAVLLPVGTPVVLVSEGKVRDKYGRILAYVEAGGVDIGERMMRDGMVDFYRDKSGTVVPFGRQARYEAAWGDAEWASAGIHNPACAP